MAEADPRDRDRLGMPRGLGEGVRQVAVVTLKTRFALLASSVWRYSHLPGHHLLTYPLTAYRSPLTAAFRTIHHSPLSPLHFGLGTADKSVAYFRALTLEMHFAASFHLPAAASWCLQVPQLLLMHYTVDALVEFCSRSVHINRFQLSNT